MEVDEHRDVNADLKANSQIIPQESCSKSIQGPKVCDDLEARHLSRNEATYAKKSHRRFHLSPRYLRKMFRCDHSIPRCYTHPESNHITVFQRREITTIHEEVFQFKRFSKKPGVQKSKSRNYKEKGASLKLFIEKLRQNNLSIPQTLNLANPNSLQNNIPDETVQLFEKFHL